MEKLQLVRIYKPQKFVQMELQLLEHHQSALMTSHQSVPKVPQVPVLMDLLQLLPLRKELKLPIPRVIRKFKLRKPLSVLPHALMVNHHFVLMELLFNQRKKHGASLNCLLKIQKGGLLATILGPILNCWRVKR